MTHPDDTQLQRYRDRIDRIDEQILRLMNRRIDAARRIGAIKSTLKSAAVYRPEREARVLKRLQKLNHGAMDAAALESLFREIMSISRSAEAGLSVAVLGPSGTYTEDAAQRHFGRAIRTVPYTTMDEIFRAAEAGETNFAVVPVENSTEGGVGATLDRLVTTSLPACGEINLKIHHHLLARTAAVGDITQVIAHAQALGQCRRWLNRHLPQARRVAAASSADAAMQAARRPRAAAIAGATAAGHYGLHRLATNIEDESGNTTRFLVFSERPAPPSGDDKTSLLLSCRHRSGALFHLLKPLFDHGINMTRLESRPSRIALWDYIFFVDVAGHQQEEPLATALRELRTEAGMYKNLGSYPIAP